MCCVRHKGAKHKYFHLSVKKIINRPKQLSSSKYIQLLKEILLIKCSFFISFFLNNTIFNKPYKIFAQQDFVKSSDA